MKQQKRTVNIFDKIGEGIGVGIIAGVAGTVAITVSQMIEMKITKRKASTGPANAVEKTLDVHPGPGNKKNMSQGVHWMYGTSWGIVRGLLSVCGLRGWTGTAVHFAAITATGLAMAPLEGQEPVTEWKPKDIGIDLLHHAIYAITAGLVFDAITGDSED